MSQQVAETAEIGLGGGGVRRIALAVDVLIGQVVEFFGAVRDALARARRSFFIIGWDIDSRMQLVPGGARDGLPAPLGDFLNAVVAGRRGLRGLKRARTYTVAELFPR